MGRFFALAAVLWLQCQPPMVLKKNPSFHYGALESKTVGYCSPVVAESVIYYKNRFTDQNYHSIDNKRTEEALLRDFKNQLRISGLAWVEASDGLSRPLRAAATASIGLLDSLPQSAVGGLISAGIDCFALVYDVRLSHVQFVGVKESGAATERAYGSSIRRTFSFKCSIFDVRANKPLYGKQLRGEETGEGLDVMEKVIGALFHDIMQK